MRKVGVFGGTFDPPHVGHLLAASDAQEALGLDQVLFVPAFAQPLKSAPCAPPADRLEMVRRLCQGDARFAVDAIEIERAGVSFTVDTLRALKAREPSAALFLLVGEDAAGTLPNWREPDAILGLAEVVVLTRGAGGVESGTAFRRVATRRVDISSTEIRARARSGSSLNGFVVDRVAAYIAERGLYR
ncbi:MAG TPA: nicotinate-nucleotide adenylyltransferase [Gemmatimonadaceae bacterium]|nr:nicotinate-nucleotide adenylyltransferase [Gemmatimonadaceae bacterium]